MALLKDGQTLDANTLEVIDAPKPAETEKPEVKDEVKDEPGDDVDDKEEVEDKETEEKEEESDDEKKDDEVDDVDAKDKEGEEKKDEDEETEEAELDLDLLDGYLAQSFEEKYGIKNEEDLQLHLEAAAEVEKENADLRAQLEEAKKNTKPAFESEQEQKIFEFLKKYPVAKMGDGMATYARLVSLDVENVAPRTALEEKFILEHEELTREEALLKFERDYNRKYKVKASSFDTQEEADAEQKNLDIDLKSDAAKAKRFLAKQQEEYKSKATADKVADQETPQVNARIQESVRTNLSEIDEYMTQLDVINFSQDDGTPAFSYKLSKQQKDQIKTAMKGWIGNPTSYDKDGKIRGEYDVDTAAINAAAMLFHSDIFEKAFTAGLSKGEIKRADQIATKKPNREAKAAIDGKRIPLTEEEQWEAALAAKKKQPKKSIYE